VVTDQLLIEILDLCDFTLDLLKFLLVFKVLHSLGLFKGAFFVTQLENGCLLTLPFGLDPG